MISLSKCKHGFTYRIRSRNLRFGVFNAEIKGFVGIREKLDHRFLFTEYHADAGPPFGTVWPVKEIGKCPVADLRECLETRCGACGSDKIHFVKENPQNATGKWIGCCDDPQPYAPGNTELFACLAKLELAEMERRLVELEQALDAIIIRCKEGDPRTNWLPTIQSIAEHALGRKGKDV